MLALAAHIMEENGHYYLKVAYFFFKVALLMLMVNRCVGCIVDRVLF